jgi:hypothetical protein
MRSCARDPRFLLMTEPIPLQPGILVPPRSPVGHSRVLAPGGAAWPDRGSALRLVVAPSGSTGRGL